MKLHLALSCLLFAAAPALRAEEGAPDPAAFRSPAAEFKAIHWVSLFLSRANEQSLTASVRAAAQTGAWGSFELGPGGGPTTGLSPEYLAASRRTPSTVGVPYLSEEYFRLYRAAIEEGQRDHFPDSMIYDEWAYPAGIVGGQFYSQHPDLMGKSLEMAEADASGPARAEVAVPAPAADYIGAVLMNLDSFERRDVSGGFAGGRVSCPVPAGHWKLMAFYLNGKLRPASQKGGAVDYLDHDAVATYIAMSYQKYYDHLKEYFGTVIKRSFYDEPSMHLVDGRMWSPHFNRDYEAKYGRSPMTLYPALWYDIGAQTAAARNALFGFHAELYARNYVGQVAQWCQDHGIEFAGHQDQEEVPNPVAITGDMMKVFEHQQVPGIDDIYYPGRTLVSYKIVTSAAYDYDWPECIAETFAAYRKMSPTIALRTILDQAAMGINMVMDARRTDIDPSSDPLIGRLDYLLRGGRHVADVGVVYPIAALQAAYYFAQPVPGQRAGDTGFTYSVEGGVLPPEIDYQDVGEILYRSLRVDYTYLHPEVLAQRCRVEGRRLVLENERNREEYRVLVLPGGDTVAASTAARLLEFYRAGGTVVATSELPTKSAEFGRDREVRAAMEEIFGMPWEHPMSAEARIVPDEVKDYFVHANPAGGRAYFIPRPDPRILGSVLKESDPVRDVEIKAEPTWPLLGGTAYQGALTYLHKVKGGKDVYFFANTTGQPVDVRVALRGAKRLQAWDPHTGEVRPAEAAPAEAGGEAVTDLHLVLPPVRSLFFLSQ
ncbi:MAG TPA: glycosyl hydrolase [Opitutaceae bacterium]|nr:glycosyl hydrolase [Opitutaceae bacterium]